MRAIPLRCGITLLSMALLLFVSACQSGNGSNGQGNRGSSGDGEDSQAVDPSITDPCAARLHDLEGALLLYYAIHKTLPEKLADLAPLADLDAPLSFDCPVSGLPYGYNREGLHSPGRAKSIIVYDPTPTKGRRWCIFMAPAAPGASRSLQVLSVTEPFFLGYQPLAR